MAKRVALNDVPQENGGKYALLKGTDELNAGDRRAIRAAVPLTLGADGRTLVYPGDYDDQMRNALLARIITEWNLDLPVPRGDSSVLDRLDLDSCDRLYEACQEHVDFLSSKIINPMERGSDPI